MRYTEDDELLKGNFSITCIKRNKSESEGQRGSYRIFVNLKLQPTVKVARS